MAKEFSGTTKGTLDAIGHVGIKAVFSHTAENRPKLMFDISWGVNDPAKRRFNTWKHCIAYDDIAEALKEIKPGDLMHVTGWIATNPVTDGIGKLIIYGQGKYLTKEFVIITFAEVLKKADIQNERQLGLVA